MDTVENLLTPGQYEGFVAQVKAIAVMYQSDAKERAHLLDQVAQAMAAHIGKEESYGVLRKRASVIARSELKRIWSE